MDKAVHWDNVMWYSMWRSIHLVSKVGGPYMYMY